MTQNQSGKQLFEWVKASVTPPPKDGDYSIRRISTSTIDTSWYQRSRNEFTDASILFDDLEWLCPAQPSTGKPTEQEAKDLLTWYFGKLSDSKIYGWEDMIEPMIMFAERFTGKQLPTDEEIVNEAMKAYPEKEFKLRMQVGFVNGAKWMRERAQGESDKWIRVEDERKPAPNVYVLVHYYNGYEIAEYRERDNTFRIGYDLVRNVTHWQPLPNAPMNK